MPAESALPVCPVNTLKRSHFYLKADASKVKRGNHQRALWRLVTALFLTALGQISTFNTIWYYNSIKEIKQGTTE